MLLELETVSFPVFQLVTFRIKSCKTDYCVIPLRENLKSEGVGKSWSSRTEKFVIRKNDCTNRADYTIPDGLGCLLTGNKLYGDVINYSYKVRIAFRTFPGFPKPVEPRKSRALTSAAPPSSAPAPRALGPQPTA